MTYIFIHAKYLHTIVYEYVNYMRLINSINESSEHQSREMNRLIKKRKAIICYRYGYFETKNPLKKSKVSITNKMNNKNLELNLENNYNLNEEWFKSFVFYLRLNKPALYDEITFDGKNIQTLMDLLETPEKYRHTCIDYELKIIEEEQEKLRKGKKYGYCYDLELLEQVSECLGIVEERCRNIVFRLEKENKTA